MSDSFFLKGLFTWCITDTLSEVKSPRLLDNYLGTCFFFISRFWIEQWIIIHVVYFHLFIRWVGLRENLQESMDFHVKHRGFNLSQFHIRLLGSFIFGRKNRKNERLIETTTNKISMNDIPLKHILKQSSGNLPVNQDRCGKPTKNIDHCPNRKPWVFQIYLSLPLDKL